MKNVIMQHYTGDLDNKEMERESINNMKAYAYKFGAHHILLRGQVFDKNLTFPLQKLEMLDEKYDEYDNIVMVDIDMFAVKGLEENVFDAPGNGLHGPVQEMLHRRLVKIYPDSAKYPYWGGAIYKFNRNERIILRENLKNRFTSGMYNHFNKPYQFEDEGVMHVQAILNKFKWNGIYMDKKWCQCSFLPDPQEAAFIHIRTKQTPTGPKRDKNINWLSLIEMGIL
jgi:hypothetical protein